MHALTALKQRFQASDIDNVGQYFTKTPSSGDRQLRCRIPIVARQEALVPIPPQIARQQPHPYQCLGGPYGNHAPYMLRVSVAKRLGSAQAELTQRFSGYRLQVFDAYRPLAVQAFMIDHETRKLARERGLEWEQLGPAERTKLQDEVLCFWAPPNPDPTQPPPHSTGAAIDITIINGQNEPLNMGTPIDHVGPESFPNHFANLNSPQTQAIHKNRQLLREVMIAAGFRQLPYEWWHFSYGDQWWALLEYLEGNSDQAQALYGGVTVSNDLSP